MAWDLFEPLGIIAQLDGSKFGGENCAAATAAMHAMSERQGKRPPKGAPWPPSGASIRQATGDKSGGLKPSQIDTTLNRVYDIDPDFVIVSQATVAAKLRSGYPVTSLRWEGPIADAGFEGSRGFRGNHSSLESAVKGTGVQQATKDCNPLFDGRKAGIPEGPQWVPWKAFVRASELLVINDQGTRMIDRYGAGMCYVGFGRIPYRPGEPVKTIRYSVRFPGTEFWTYDVKGGVIQPKRHARQFSAPTSAQCGPPAVYPWPGNLPRRLVRMTTGALMGEYVAVPQGGARLVEKEVTA